MSLWIHLYEQKDCPHCGGKVDTSNCVYETNVYHSVGKYAVECYIYPFLWRAPECGIARAEQLIKPLLFALEEINKHPEKFTAVWHRHTDLLKPDTFREWLIDLKDACLDHPDAVVETSR